MNKTSRKKSYRWLQAAIGLALLAVVGWQVRGQWQAGPGWAAFHAGPWYYLVFAVMLLLLNISAESFKWQLLLRLAMPRLTFMQSVRSVLTGIAASVVTPNRLGEYPARMLRLGGASPYRLVTAAVLGSLSQMVALFLCGAFAAGWYAMNHPLWWTTTGALLSTAGAACALLFFLRYERWLPRLAKLRWLRKYAILGRSLGVPQFNRQAAILALSLGRFCTYTAQYLLLLRGAGIPLPWWEGFTLCALFFWVLAVVPSVALAEIGIRGGVALFLFAPFTQDRIGILAATLALWLMNLALPALTGAALLLRPGPKP